VLRLRATARCLRRGEGPGSGALAALDGVVLHLDVSVRRDAHREASLLALFKALRAPGCRLAITALAVAERLAVVVGGVAGIVAPYEVAGTALDHRWDRVRVAHVALIGVRVGERRVASAADADRS